MYGVERKGAGGPVARHTLALSTGLLDCVPIHGPLSTFLHLLWLEQCAKEITFPPKYKGTCNPRAGDPWDLRIHIDTKACDLR